MNKTELIAAVAKKSGLTKKDTDAAIKAFADVVTEELTNGGKVQFVGFGTFEVAERAERTAKNPRTGETMTVAACKIPKFKACRALKNCVNK